MSGGVDSSVAAALLKEQGYSVVGVFMKFWSRSAEASRDESRLDYCLWKEERADAARVAAKLEIPLLTWDFTQQYEKKVVEYMVGAYKSGITPNPDLMCNKEIKFGMFFDQAIAEGANFVATGHYARIKAENEEAEVEGHRNSSYKLLQAADKNKDQSYFLYVLEQRHLAQTIFPVGDYTKPEVRKMAEKFDLSTATKKDSQGVCFIGPLKMKNFLKDYIKPEKGRIIHIDGRELGEHDGVYYYTVGQRHGLDIKLGGGPYLVVSKNIEKNIVYVGEEKDLFSDQATVSNIHWIGEKPVIPSVIGVKIRYRSETVPARISCVESCILGVNPELPARSRFAPGDAGRRAMSYELRFDKSVRAITPGQAAVFYDGEIVLGGGTIVL